MATIEKRTSAGRTSYRARIRIQGAPSQTATFQRKTDAVKWAKSIEAAVHEGRYLPSTEARKHTLADLIDRYAQDVLPAKKDGAHQGRQLAWWKEQLGDYALSSITPALIAEARDQLARQPTSRGPAHSPATVVRYLAVLSHAFTIAVKEYGWLELNPVLRATKPKEPRGRVRFLEDEERERLLAACRASASPDLYPAVVLALSTGARRMEIMSLRWPQIDFARKSAVLHDTKNGERRVLHLSGPALDLLQERSKVRRLDTDLVFPGRARQTPGGSHKPAAPIELRGVFLKALVEAGIEDFRWHDLRHSAASYLAMNGAGLAEIAEVLGHKTLAMVKRYAHLSEAHTASVVESMNARIFSAE